MSEIKEFTAIGRRKESTARVRLRPGDGKFLINRRPFENYFPRETHRLVVLQPFDITINMMLSPL
jgi:small subunit ribosomal protein S9